MVAAAHAPSNTIMPVVGFSSFVNVQLTSAAQIRIASHPVLLCAVHA